MRGTKETVVSIWADLDGKTIEEVLEFFGKFSKFAKVEARATVDANGDSEVDYLVVISKK